MARVALMVLAVVCTAFVGEVVGQGCAPSLALCPLGSFILQGSSCADGAAPLALNFTTLGALLGGASGSGVGLTAGWTSSLSVALSTVGGLLTGGGSTATAAPLKVEWVPLYSFVGK